MVLLSKSDRRILKALQESSDFSMRELGERLSLSSSTLWRRINELENAGVIRKRVALLDPASVGTDVNVFVYVDMVNYNENDRLAFEDFVQTVPEILECYSMTGAHDYTLIVRANSVDDFERLLMQRLLAHKSVASATSQIALRQLKYTTELPISDD